MNINLDLYNYFYYVCEFKSITKAANFLYISQPAITKQIKKLENTLGKKLIISSTRGIDLTEEGHFLYEEIKESIQKLNETEARFKEINEIYNETIKIIAGHSSLTKFLLKSFTEFNKTHPKIKFEASSYRFQESIQLLREGKVDLIFLSMEELTEKYSNIEVCKFMDVEDIFVVSKETKNNYPSNIKILELNNYPIISLSNHMLSRKWIDDYYEKHHMEFKPKFELSSTWLVGEYVAQGIGIGILVKQHILDELKNGQFIQIKTDVNLPSRTMAYAYQKGCLKQQVIKEFIEYLKKYNYIKD